MLVGAPAQARTVDAVTPAQHESATAQRSPGCGLSSILVPSCGRWIGAYAKPVGSESAEQAFRNLQRISRSKLRVVHFYHQGRELFPSPWEIKLSRQGHRLLLNWKPEQGHTWRQVANGASDSYIDAEAAYLRHHYPHKKFFLVLHHEPENEVDQTRGSGMRAGDFAAMFRHVEDRLRSHGVHNAVYVVNYMGAQTYWLRSWHKKLWPGSKYVDWVGMDRYAAPNRGGQSGGFLRLMNRHFGDRWPGAYRAIHRQYPGKPIMLCEWGIAEKAGAPLWKPRLFGSVVDGLRKLPHLKLVSYQDSATPDAGYDLRVNTSSRSLTAWRRLVSRTIFHR